MNDLDHIVVPIVEASVSKREAVTIDYTNHRGERGTRVIWPISIYYGVNKYHSGPQWLLMAVDLGKSGLRVYAMKDIHSWKASNAT